jgi:hypothetical protein
MAVIKRDKKFTFLTPVLEHQGQVKQEKSMCFNFIIFDKFCIFHSTYIHNYGHKYTALKRMGDPTAVPTYL